MEGITGFIVFSAIVVTAGLILIATVVRRMRDINTAEPGFTMDELENAISRLNKPQTAVDIMEEATRHDKFKKCR